LACKGIFDGRSFTLAGREAGGPPIECPCGMSFETGWLHIPTTKRHKATSSNDRQRRRKRVYERDGNKCVNCGHEGDDANPLTLDHKLPLSRGGTNRIGNLQTMCFDCNQAKADSVQ
jgi:hypothetical protein